MVIVLMGVAGSGKTTVGLQLAAALGWLDYISGIWVSLQFFYLVPIVLAVAWLGWRSGCAIVGAGIAAAAS